MSFLGWFRKKPVQPSLAPNNGPLRRKLVDLILSVLRAEDKGIHAEDAISAAATVVGERCIDVAGDFPLRNHDLPPGSRAFSTRANELICGDMSDADINQIPKETVIGYLRSRLDAKVFKDADFPALKEVFGYFAAHVGDPADWGKVPLSIPEAHFPFIPPLQIGYQIRDQVDAVLSPAQNDKQRCLRIATESLAEILSMSAYSIDHRVALTLAIETINGMAKTAPMTLKAMQQACQSSPPVVDF